MGRKIIFVAIVVMTLMLTACVGESLKMDNSANGEQKSNTIQNEKGKDNVSNNTDDTVLTYRVEPKATYEPENKIGYPEIYGSTQEEVDYQSELNIKEEKATNVREKEINPPIVGELMKAEQMFSIGDEVSLDMYKCIMKVNSVKVNDSIGNVSEEDFFDKEIYSDVYVDEKGQLKECRRIEETSSGKVISKEEVNINFITLDITLKGDSEWVTEVPIGNLILVPFVENGEYYQKYTDYENKNESVSIYYEPLSSNKDEKRLSAVNFSLGIEPVYFDKAIFRKMQYRSHFFHTYITKNETINFRLGYYVDENMLEKCCLYYSNNRGDEVYTDSILQRGIKLF